MLSQFLEDSQLNVEDKLKKSNRIISLNYRSIVQINHTQIAHSVRELYLNHNLLSSLEGIQQFTNIRHFEIKFNQIRSLNEFTKINSKLKVLNCIGNPVENDEWFCQSYFTSLFKRLQSFNNEKIPISQNNQDIKELQLMQSIEIKLKNIERSEKKNNVKMDQQQNTPFDIQFHKNYNLLQHQSQQINQQNIQKVDYLSNKQQEEFFLKKCKNQHLDNESNLQNKSKHENINKNDEQNKSKSENLSKHDESNYLNNSKCENLPKKDEIYYQNNSKCENISQHNESNLKLYQFKDIINQRLHSFRKDKQNLSELIDSRTAKGNQTVQSYKPQKNFQQSDFQYTHKKNSNEIDFIQKLQENQNKQQQLNSQMNEQLQLRLMINSEIFSSKRLKNSDLSSQLENLNQENQKNSHNQIKNEPFKTSNHVQNLNNDIQILATIFNNKNMLKKSFNQLKLNKDLHLIGIFKTTYEQKLKLKIFASIKIHNYEKKLLSQINKQSQTINENLKLISYYNKNHQSKQQFQSHISFEQPALSYSDLK